MFDEIYKQLTSEKLNLQVFDHTGIYQISRNVFRRLAAELPICEASILHKLAVNFFCLGTVLKKGFFAVEP